MKRLVFIVEGDLEVLFIDKTVAPYLIKKGFNISIKAQTIVTNRKQHKKGGVNSYGLFENDVKRTLSQGNIILTTMIDFFRLPTDFPNFTTNSSQIHLIEQAIHQKFDNNPYFIPYIQRHELESLMFSDRSGFELVIDDSAKMNEIDKIIETYPNPEDINSGSETYPSKRLEKIFGYDKIGEGELIFEMIEMESILLKCPKFALWIQKIIDKLSE